MEFFGFYLDEAYLKPLFFVHFLISLLLAFVASSSISSRYVTDTKEAKENDYKRLEQIQDRSWLFKFLFKISLHKNNPFSSKMFFFLFNFSIPIIGYFETLWITYLLKYTVYEEEIVDTNILDLEEFGVSFLKVERVFGEGSMTNVLLNPYVPLSKKIRALSALSATKSPATLQIIKKALSSKDDEVRLFAYATINNLEKKLGTDISNALRVYKELKEHEDTLEFEEKNRLYSATRELAFFYWEMVYTEISHDALKNNFLKEVEKYAKEAIAYYEERSKILMDRIDALESEQRVVQKQENELLLYKVKRKYNIAKEEAKNVYNYLAKLYTLLGKVYMQRKDYDYAREYFTLAQEVKESDSDFVIPYLAEIYFIQNRYRIVKNIINQKAEELSLNPRLYPIIQQWSKDDAEN